MKLKNSVIFSCLMLFVLIFLFCTNNIEPTFEAPDTPSAVSSVSEIPKAKTRDAQETSVIPTPQGVTVYITNTGKKYHRDGCRYLSESKISTTLETAMRSYGACSVCKPPS